MWSLYHCALLGLIGWRHRAAHAARYNQPVVCWWSLVKPKSSTGIPPGACPSWYSARAYPGKATERIALAVVCNSRRWHYKFKIDLAPSSYGYGNCVYPDSDTVPATRSTRLKRRDIPLHRAFGDVSVTRSPKDPARPRAGKHRGKCYNFSEESNASAVQQRDPKFALGTEKPVTLCHIYQVYDRTTQAHHWLASLRR